MAAKWFDEPKGYTDRTSSTYELSEPRGSYTATVGIQCSIFWLCPKNNDAD